MILYEYISLSILVYATLIRASANKRLDSRKIKLLFEASPFSRHVAHVV